MILCNIPISWHFMINSWAIIGKSNVWAVLTFMREAVIIYSKHESYLCTLHQIKNGKQNLFYLHDASDLLIILFECVEWGPLEPSKHCLRTDLQGNQRNFILLFVIRKDKFSNGESLDIRLVSYIFSVLSVVNEVLNLSWIRRGYI